MIGVPGDASLVKRNDLLSIPNPLRLDQKKTHGARHCPLRYDLACVDILAPRMAWLTSKSSHHAENGGNAREQCFLSTRYRAIQAAQQDGTRGINASKSTAPGFSHRPALEHECVRTDFLHTAGV